MTNHWIDLKNADVILVMGSNAAENHPISFKWVQEAKDRGATLISVDPRFTRTTARADIYAPLRSGSDIAFLGGMINHILRNDLVHRDYVRLYTNATFVEHNAKGQVVNRTNGIASVGSAALDNEECYLYQKWLRGLGLVAIEHQARI